MRYAAINHPGDKYSADMLSQIAKAMKAHQGLDPMKGLKVKRVIAAGQSQSADKLYDYVTQWQATADVIDGFLIHGNGTVKKTFPAKLTVPVLNLLSDREAEPEKPTKDKNYRLWEVSGTGHSGYFIGVQQVQGSSQRVAGLPPVTGPATPRSWTTPATTARSSTRGSLPASSTARRCRCTTRPVRRCTSCGGGSAPASAHR